MISVKSNLAFLTFFAVGLCSAKAQSLSPEVVASSGDVFSNTAGSVSFTIGEPVTATFSVPANILTQGFQQPYTVSLTGIPEESAATEIYVYPNPVKDELMIDFTKMNAGSYLLTIADVSGREIMNSKMEIGSSPALQKISLSEYGNGIYFIRVISPDNKSSKAFK